MKSGLCETTYEKYVGKNTEQMPLLLADGKSPLSMAGIMKGRILYCTMFSEWLNLWFDTSDLLAYEGRGGNGIKHVLTTDKEDRITLEGRKTLELITPQAELTKSRAIKLGERYDALNGVNVLNLKIKDFGITERRLSNQEVLDSKLWRIAARDPNEVPEPYAITKDEFQEFLAKRLSEVPEELKGKDLLTVYRDLIFAKTRRSNDMGVYLDSNEVDAKLRAWCVDRLGNRSDASSGSNLDIDNGCFAGLAPEAPIVPISVGAVVRPSIEQVLALQGEYVAKGMQPQYAEQVKALFGGAE